jgi:hypothetical protein
MRNACKGAHTFFTGQRERERRERNRKREGEIERKRESEKEGERDLLHFSYLVWNIFRVIYLESLNIKTKERK